MLQTEEAGVLGSERTNIVAEFRGGIVLSVVLAIAGYLIGLSPIGEHIRSETTNWLQGHLVADRDVGLAVIDISEIPNENRKSGQPVVTQRKALLDIISALTRRKPKAIGIDIDFSPEDEGKYVTNVDPAFFRFCLFLRNGPKGVPVFLGVSRFQAASPEAWLGAPEFKQLGASILVPTRTIRSVRWIGSKAVPTMSGALANAAGTAPLGWQAKCPANLVLANVSPQSLGKGLLSFGEFPVDYSPIEQFQREALVIPREAFDRPELIDTVLSSRPGDWRDQVVLVGDLKNDKDLRPVPGHSDHFFPGVLLHACAAYTMISAPLYEIRRGLEPFIDVAISSFLLLVVCSTRLHYHHRGGLEVNEKRMMIVITGITVSMLVVFGGLLVQEVRIFWDGLSIVCAVLVLHPKAESLWGLTKTTWERLMFLKRGKS